MLHILQVGDVLVSPNLFTVKFCCDLSACKGKCCIEGDAGAPVTLDEIGSIEDCLDEVWHGLSASAQSVIDRQGVAYSDAEGELVTSIVGGKDCVFTCYEDLDDQHTGHTIGHCCLCALERAYRAGQTAWCKPVSCALYPVREKQLGDGLVGLNYHQWDICRDALSLGRKLNLPLYRFLREPLIRRFGEAWYRELCDVADELRRQRLLDE